MRTNIDGYEIEGTPEEISTFLRLHNADNMSKTHIVEAVDRTHEEDVSFASEEIAYKALTRRPMSPAQKKLFRKLLEASPNWVLASELQEATSYNPNQLGGLLGATGRRLSQTPGYIKSTALLEWEWDEGEEEYLYRLPASVLRAVQRINP